MGGIRSLINDLSEHEHLIVLAPVSAFLVGHGGTMMIPVPELDDMESAAVDIEMDVALLEVASPWSMLSTTPPTNLPSSTMR